MVPIKMYLVIIACALGVIVAALIGMMQSPEAPSTDVTLPGRITGKTKDNPSYRVARYDNGKFKIQYLATDGETYFAIGAPDEFIEDEEKARRYCQTMTEIKAKRSAKVVEILDPR